VHEVFVIGLASDIDPAKVLAAARALHDRVAGRPLPAV